MRSNNTLKGNERPPVDPDKCSPRMNRIIMKNISPDQIEEDSSLIKDTKLYKNKNLAIDLNDDSSNYTDNETFREKKNIQNEIRITGKKGFFASRRNTFATKNPKDDNYGVSESKKNSKKSVVGSYHFSTTIEHEDIYPKPIYSPKNNPISTQERYAKHKRNLSLGRNPHTGTPDQR